MYAYFATFLQYENVQMWVLVLFTVTATTMGCFSYLANSGLSITNVVPYDSYIIDYVNTQDDLFPSPIHQLSIIVRDLDYTDKEQVSDMLDYFMYVERYDGTEGSVGMAAGYWYAHYAAYLNDKSKNIYEDFPYYLQDFLDSEDGEQFRVDVKCYRNEVGDCIDVTSSRYMFWNSCPEDTVVINKINTDLNDKITKYGLPKRSYVFTESFLYASTDVKMYR